MRIPRSPSTRRAWIEIVGLGLINDVGSSPSTRRAWIEISSILLRNAASLVALHPEGVDRNRGDVLAAYLALKSPSTRRAWIEMQKVFVDKSGIRNVALHPEGVDRNAVVVAAD